MRKTRFVILLLVIAMLSGCVYANVMSPLDMDLDSTTLGQKTGEASIYSVLWLVAWGDASTAAAAANGNISTINHMDQHTYSILFGLYSKSTIIVYGD